MASSRCSCSMARTASSTAFPTSRGAGSRRPGTTTARRRGRTIGVRRQPTRSWRRSAGRWARSSPARRARSSSATSAPTPTPWPPTCAPTTARSSSSTACRGTDRRARRLPLHKHRARRRPHRRRRGVHHRPTAAGPADHRRLALLRPRRQVRQRHRRDARLAGARPSVPSRSRLPARPVLSLPGAVARSGLTGAGRAAKGGGGHPAEATG